MNYALNFTGVGHVTVPTLTGGGAAGRICRADIELANYTTQSIMGNNLSGAGSSIRIMSATSVQVRIGELSARTITLPANSIPLNTRLVLEVFKTSAPALEVRVNGAVVGTTAISGAGGELTTNFVVNYIGIAASTTGRFVGKMYELDLFGNTFLNTDQPAATTWGTGTLVGFQADPWIAYGGADVTPPTFTTAPAASSINQTSATITATINETGSIFWVAVPQAEATPSGPQVIAGQNAAGGAPIDAGSAVGTTSLSEVASGFTAGTPYKFCVVARDDETTPNVQASVTVVNFTTSPVAQVPQGVVTLGTITTGQNTASVPFTYSLADQTGFEYRLNGGTTVTGTVSPQNLTGLTTNTPYTIEIRAINGTGPGTWSTVGNFTTAAAPQVPQGTFIVGTASVTETTASIPYTYSAADQTGIEYRINAGTAITASASPQLVTGLTANTGYTIQFRAINATGNGTWSTEVSFTTASAGTGNFISEPIYRLVDGTLVSNTAFTYYRLYSEAGALVVSKTGLTSGADGRVSFSDAAVVAGTIYRSDWLTANGEFCMPSKAAT